jgi:hypothetical protein
MLATTCADSEPLEEVQPIGVLEFERNGELTNNPPGRIIIQHSLYMQVAME